MEMQLFKFSLKALHSVPSANAATSKATWASKLHSSRFTRLCFKDAMISACFTLASWWHTR